VVKSKVNAIVIDPDFNARERLKQATRMLQEFGKVVPLAGFQNARDLLSRDDSYDIVFMSPRLGWEVALQYINQMKETMWGRDLAYVLILGQEDNVHSTIAKSVMKGADGILLEPFSVDALLETTHLAQRVKTQRRTTREEKALRFLVQELIDQIGIYAVLKKRGARASVTKEVLKNMSSVLRELEPDLLIRYFEIVLEQFPLVPAQRTTKISSRRYTGNSERVRRVVAKKACKQVQELRQTG